MEYIWKRNFKCTFKVLKINNQYEIREIWFIATTREAAKKQARRYLKANYGDGFEIISMSY
nr:MAG TPA: hypothetical protein [Microviridae sp.]